MAVELPPRYQAKETESKWYPFWESKGFFRPQSDRSGNPSPSGSYVIVIPPPNVTGILHMGHALNNSIQDILVRWQRMQGRDTLWVPGVDHAGIATQNVVEKKLAKEKKTRQQLGRENFLKEVWKWKDEHGSTITRQLRRLGASCDWSRERFTMDEGLSKAVREAFVTLYERGLIYQGNYIIHWCPRCQTALSDEEAAHQEVQGALYHIKYPIAGSSGKNEKMGEDHIVVATTRPETMLGDTAVAVNPRDARYAHLIGQKLVLPLLGREIPVIADEFVDQEFGTGMVKVTPAHDPNDFAMGIRHGLEQINVMHPDGRINSNGGPYHGMDRFEARKKIVEDLEARGLFVRRDSHLHAVGHCYRCHTMVEPYLSKQWFVKMQPLAQKALAAHREGKTKFYPDRWTKVYTNWLEGIRDWCISRQIWWGHQIPVWYCDHCQAQDKKEKNRRAGILVSRQTPEACPDCGNKNLRQDPDVLDTWFSSWLWPFSTLGWPGATADLKQFYPTSDLCTAPEIIFFWVARMIMAGLEFMGEVPFRRIYIHGTVRAQSGLKMSKSLGNAIDPLEVIEEMGADALRYSLVMLSAQDVYLSREKFEVGRNFTNKIWNASRFVLMNLQDFSGGSARLDVDPKTLALSDRWILSKLGKVTAEIDGYLDGFLMSQAASTLYHFIWNDFCDWAIELAKPVLAGEGGEEKRKTQKVLFFVLEKILRLLHPFMPFTTEEIWHSMKSIAADGEPWPQSVSLAAWPSGDSGCEDPRAEKAVGLLQQAVTGIRDLRTSLNIPPSQALEAVVVSGDAEVLAVVSGFGDQLKTLGRLSGVEFKNRFEKSKDYVGNAFPDLEVFIRIVGVLDPAKERERLTKKTGELRSWIASMRGKLSNENFVKNAPPEVVENEREKLADAEKVLKTHEDNLERLK
jgi:valyl-tRNA synthetase